MARTEVLRPAEGDHVCVCVLGDPEDVLARDADPQLESDPLRLGAVPPQKLLGPGLELVVTLVAEEKRGTESRS
jgi:hypothetical protein